jgi:ADP-ribosylglycohydrolase
MDAAQSARATRDRVEGLLSGSLIGDALALGAHWVYDQQELQRDFGRVTDFLDPRPDSYHPTKKKGQQTHYGDQALTLMASLTAHGGFQEAAFAQDWRRMWVGYRDYFDHATKQTLENLQAGVPATSAGSDSNELGGAARIAPLLAMLVLTDEPVESAVLEARAQTRLTHRSKLAGDAAELLTRIVLGLFAGGTLPEMIAQAAAGSYDELDMRSILDRVQQTRSLEVKAAALSLGLACPVPQALPTLLMLLDRCDGNFETAIIENVMAGGDNAARGLALGMILGAVHGKSRIPDRWLQGLAAAPGADAFLRFLS